MNTYQVSNDNGVAARVTDAQLEEAAAGEGELPTQLANAAAIAGRRELTTRLRATLSSALRPRRLAAAKALLAFGDAASISALEERATAEADAISAKVFTAVALRLRGPDHVAARFDDPESDPQLCRLLISNYNSHLVLEAGDVRFLARALGALADRSRPWIRKLRADLRDNAAYIAILALATAPPTLVVAALGAEGAALATTLDRLVAGCDDEDLLAAAAELRGRLVG